MKYILVLVGVFWVTSMQAQTNCGTLNWDAAIVRDCNQYQSTKSLSHLVSDALYPVAVGTPLAFYASGYFGKDKFTAQTGLTLAAVEATTFVTVVGLKQLIGRNRPYVEYPDCITGGENDPLKSFPSGHAAGSAAIVTYLSLRYPKWYVIAPSVAYFGYTCYARMNLGMHYPTDIIVGALIGGAIGYGGYLLSDSVSESLAPLMPVTMVKPNNDFSFSISIGL